MDLVSSCKDKLAYFRLKELKDVLSQLGLAKQGKKQDLVYRILALLSDEQVPRSHGWGKKKSIGKEGVAKIIDDIYRKMQGPGATDLASQSHSGSDLILTKAKEEVDESFDNKVRCPCGSSLFTDTMIKCEDPRCQVWQHISCVVIPEKPMEGVPPELPDQFYCDICRINRTDPFWVTMGHPLLPLMLASSDTLPDGTSTSQNLDKTFPLSETDREMLQRTEYDLQVWCILLNDKVPFRMQWPQYPELKVNDVPVRLTNRPGSQLLGNNGRDDGPVITTCSREGLNKICLTRSDARVFCFGVRLAKRRTFQQVLNLVPMEADGERFEDALARVRRCTGGGTATENADSDSDLVVVTDSVTVNLRCPMTGSRMKIAGRFKHCAHMGCFDLEGFVELNQRSRKWQCPICLKNYSSENIIIDPYFNRITSLMRNCGEDVNEIDVKPDGSWRAKNEGDCRDLAQWHLPDGSLCPTTDADVKPDLEILRQIKLEGTSEGHTGLRLGIKRNRNGVWEVSKPEYMRPPSSGDHLPERFENNFQKMMPMSGSASGSFRDGEDPSVNQGGGHFDFSVNNGHELDCISLDFDPTYDVEDGIPPAPLKDADVIILTDSEDENVTMISPETIFDAGPVNGIPFSANHPGVSERFSEDPGLGTSGTSRLGLFSDDFGMPLWPMQTGPQADPGFQIFGTDAENRDPVGGYGLASGGGLGDSLEVRDLSTSHSNTEANGSLVDNPLAFGGDDPSLQIFLPSRSAGVTLESDLGDRMKLRNGEHPDDWISLTLAAGGGCGDSAPANGLNSRQQLTRKESRMESLADASLLLSMSEDRAKKSTSNSQRLDTAFSHVPRQPRSVRPRLYLSIDTDSD